MMSARGSVSVWGHTPLVLNPFIFAHVASKERFSPLMSFLHAGMGLGISRHGLGILKVHVGSCRLGDISVCQTDISGKRHEMAIISLHVTPPCRLGETEDKTA